MSEWLSPFVSRVLLRTLSALLTICLLAQFFIAGVAASRSTYHSDRVAIFQWLVIPLPILAWLGGHPRGRRTLFACIPLLQVALQYVLAPAQSKDALRLVCAYTPWMPGYCC